MRVGVGILKPSMVTLGRSQPLTFTGRERGGPRGGVTEGCVEAVCYEMTTVVPGGGYSGGGMWR